MSIYLEPHTAHQPEVNDLKQAIVVQDMTDNSSDDEPCTDDQALPGHITASPYSNPTHQLDLSTLDTPFAQFAQALQDMRASRSDYATAPYAESFNWKEIVQSYAQLYASATPAQVSFFVIVFRSRLKQDADRALLGELDEAAHLEAVDAGGLLKYWFGSPDRNRRNLATCLWRARDDARFGGAGPGHAAAMTAARKMYDEWFVERLRLTVDMTSSSWRFEEWSDSD